VTPDELRALADEATSDAVPARYFPEKVGPGSWDPVVMRSYMEMHQRHQFDHEAQIKCWIALMLLDRVELMPDLARLCAELGEALQRILSPWDGTQHPSVQKALAPARAALAKLSELKAQ